MQFPTRVAFHVSLVQWLGMYTYFDFWEKFAYSHNFHADFIQQWLSHNHSRVASATALFCLVASYRWNDQCETVAIGFCHVVRGIEATGMIRIGYNEK